MVALMATFSVQTTLAGYYTIGGVIGVDDKGNAITGTIKPTDIPSAVAHPSGSGCIYAPIVKDGSGTITVEGDGYYQNDLFVREGKMIFKSDIEMPWYQSDNNADMHRNPNEINEWDANPLDGMVRLAVSGKDSVLEFDNAKFYLKNNWGTHINVGGVNGNGTLIVKNGSRFIHDNEDNPHTGDGYSTHIGGPSTRGETNLYKIGSLTCHATTIAPGQSDEDVNNRYYGNYVNGSIDPSQEFGRGDVLVQSDSAIYFSGAGGGLYMSEGSLTIEDNSEGHAGNSYLGIHSGCLSEIDITSGSTMYFFKNLYSGEHKDDLRKIDGELVAIKYPVENAKVIINVDGGSAISVTNSAELSTDDENTTTTTLSLTNNSKAEFGSLTVGSESGNSTAEINIDKTSSVTAYNPDKPMMITINHGSVNNAGTVEAASVTINNGGTLSMIGADSALDAGEVIVRKGGTLQAEGGKTVELAADKVSVDEGGFISLMNGSTMKTKALTMATGSAIKLSGGYSAGDILMISDNLDAGSLTVTMDNGLVEYIIENDTISLTAVFDNRVAEAFTASNWGIATASRAFVDTVRGQHTNTGCIANGRGTAWAAVLGGTSDIGKSDIDLKGAAVGADMKVGRKSSIGVAFGYVDGDAAIPGMRKVEQEGTYMALYGEHGLRKLSDTSCLSFDWVAAYGQTNAEWESAEWEQQSLQLNSRLSWNKQVTDQLCMSVFGGLEYFTSESDTVGNAKSGSIQNLRGEIGVGVRYVAWGTPASQAVQDEKGVTITAGHPGCEKLVLHGEISYMNDMVRSNPVIEQDGLRGGTENPGRHGMGIEAGATYRINERWSTSANYSFSTMDDSREHRVNVGASYTF